MSGFFGLLKELTVDFQWVMWYGKLTMTGEAGEWPFVLAILTGNPSVHHATVNDCHDFVIAFAVCS